MQSRIQQGKNVLELYYSLELYRQNQEYEYLRRARTSEFGNLTAHNTQSLSQKRSKKLVRAGHHPGQRIYSLCPIICSVLAVHPDSPHISSGWCLISKTSVALDSLTCF